MADAIPRLTTTKARPLHPMASTRHPALHRYIRTGKPHLLTATGQWALRKRPPKCPADRRLRITPIRRVPMELRLTLQKPAWPLQRLTGATFLVARLTIGRTGTSCVRETAPVTLAMPATVQKLSGAYHTAAATAGWAAQIQPFAPLAPSLPPRNSTMAPALKASAAPEPLTLCGP